MRFPQTASASPANARERRTLPPPPPPSPPSPSPRRDRSRTRKKQKRLDAIRDRVLDPVEHGAGGSGAVDVDPSSLRRSTRQRRPPAVSDLSPSPPKKRSKGKKTANLGGGGRRNEGDADRKNGKRKRGVEKVLESPNSGELGEMGNWGTRLRSRARNVGAATKEKRSPPRGKRRLFKELDGFGNEDELVDEKTIERPEGGVSWGSKSRRSGVEKESIDADNGDQDVGPSNAKEGRGDQPLQEHLSPLNKEAALLPAENATDGGSGSIPDDGSAQEYEKEDIRITAESESAEPGSDQQELHHCEPVEGQCGNVNGDCSNDSKASKGTILSTDLLERDDQIDAHPDNLCSKHISDDNGIKVDQSDPISNDSVVDQPRIREGRRCGLCGGGTDGKPPKRLVRDSAESDHEVYGGSSASEEPNYDELDGFGDESGWLGPLLGPIHDRFGIAGVWVHQHCAVWSPEVYFAGLGRLKNVRAALCRGRPLKCSHCGQPGATIGCRVDRCPKTYHLPCSRADGCIFDHRKFLIACRDHRRLFQPQGSLYLHRRNKMKAKKMKLDMRKLSIDAWRKDFETEEKWLENCGEDEEFLRREGKRLHRDITRIAPVHIGGPSFDGEKSYQGWESVAGLKDVIQCMKEVVILPLLYPEFFSTLGLTPPRGVLLHGYPGTGKTLVVRALIGACSRGDKRIAYFARKGADCLGKYVGDAERQLRLLFQVAERSQPSIIFFDEIDGLAPRRCRQQDQTHSSVVSTLLALLDGLKSRGSVIVIGATNRPEALDPALRRPGRFDREIYFPLPSAEDRSAILSLHTQRWPKPVSGSLLTWVAEQTPGFAGADLQSLCTQAAMIALKRNCALQELLSAAEKYPSNVRRHSLPSFVVDERDWLAALASAPPPCSRREAGIAANGVVSSPLHKSLVPCLLLPLSHLLTSLYHDERIQLPPPLYKAATLINGVINFAMQQKKIPIAFWSTHLHSLIQEPEIAGEIERKLSCAGLLMGTPYSSNCGLLDDDTDHEKLEFHKSNPSGSHMCRNLVHNFSYSQGIKSRFRLLVAGTPRSGQQHLAACLLHGFLGHIEIQKVSLATMSQEGHGDLVQGITHILLKCLSMGRCIIYMPRIDLWAVDGAHHKVSEQESGFCQRVSKSTLTREHHDGLDNASESWNSFVEQVDSVCSSTSLMILATCEMPNHAIPLRIRQFFTRDVLNCKDSAPLEHTIPRFLVQVDGNFSRELVIDSSAAKLLLDLVQQYIQLIHHGSHKCNSNTLNEVKIVNTVEVNSEVQIQKAEKGATNVVMDTEVGSERIPLSDSVCTDINIQQSKNDNNRCSVKSSCQLEDEVWLQPHSDPLSKLTQNRIAKGKSNLLMAIATFGYQILRYPHFAELCWATSKLKEGPCTGINGPWKVWPFNTCIIHADRSLEKEGSKCNSTNHKSRERSGVVRGLVAVGLLAYRGVYTSIREVSLEVRKVLELLVSEIDRKIQGGKDRWRFLRLLSQVAYFEDMVNSWAYGLRSFEMDNQVSSLNSKAVIVKRQVNML